MATSIHWTYIEIGTLKQGAAVRKPKLWDIVLVAGQKLVRKLTLKAGKVEVHV